MISLVMTVKDEIETLPALWRSIEGQVRLPDEVVVVDGGSEDGTQDFFRDLDAPFVVRFEEIEGNISQGRNAAVGLSRGDTIAVTDGGCVLDPGWLSALAWTIEGGADVASGSYYPLIESARDALFACVCLKAPHQFRPERFMPSHRSIAYRREVFDSVGGYPQWLDYGEDMYFNHRAEERGARFAFSGEAVAYWRMRQDLRSLMKQFERYAYGDGRSFMYPERHLVRFCTYLVLVPLLFRKPAGRVLALCGAIAYAQSRMRRIPVFMSGFSIQAKAAAALATPPLMAILDFSRMAGYLRGLIEGISERAGGPGRVHGVRP